MQIIIIFIHIWDLNIIHLYTYMQIIYIYIWDYRLYYIYIILCTHPIEKSPKCHGVCNAGCARLQGREPNESILRQEGKRCTSTEGVYPPVNIQKAMENRKDPPFLMGKLTISMELPEGSRGYIDYWIGLGEQLQDTKVFTIKYWVFL